MNLLGEFPVAIDSKGRLRLPTGLLRQLGPKPEGDAAYEFVINRGFEKCLTLWPRSVWDVMAVKINRLNRFNDRNRLFARNFFGLVTEVETDSADRILIQKNQLEYAGLTEEAILIAQMDRIEIWSPATYNEMMQINPNDYADLANVVMGGGGDGVGSETDLDLDDIFSR